MTASAYLFKVMVLSICPINSWVTVTSRSTIQTEGLMTVDNIALKKSPLHRGTHDNHLPTQRKTMLIRLAFLALSEPDSASHSQFLESREPDECYQSLVTPSL